MFDRYSLRTKLLAAFAAVLALTSALSLFLISGQQSVKNEMNELYEDNFKSTVAAASVRDAALTYVLDSRRHILSSNATDQAEISKDLDEQTVTINENLAILKVKVSEPEEVALFDDFESAFAPTRARMPELLALSSAGNDAGATAILTELTTENDEAIAILTTVVEHQSEQAEIADHAASDKADQDRSIALVLLGLLLVISAMFAWWLSRHIGNALSVASRQLDSSADGLGTIATQLSTSAEETASQSQVVAAVAEELSANMSAVSAAIEEMQASVSEIANNAGEVSRVASGAVVTVDSTNVRVEQLGIASQEIGKVIEVITSIAEQTNLLALNATIEAARAGDAGKGFAVVANEVKELAKATASATQEIGQRVTAIQSESAETVTSIFEIAGIMTQINDMQSAIAAAVEEQAAVTSEIARNVSEAAGGSTEIAKNIVSVSNAALQTSAGAATANEVAISVDSVARLVNAVIDGRRGRLVNTPSVGRSSTSSHVAQPRRDYADAIDRSNVDPESVADGRYRIKN